jgi:hypothetical protein
MGGEAPIGENDTDVDPDTVSVLVGGSVVGMGGSIFLSLLLRLTFKGSSLSSCARRLLIVSLAACLFVWLPLLPDLLHPVPLGPGNLGDEGKAFEAMLGMVLLPATVGSFFAWLILKCATPEPHEVGPQEEWVSAGRAGWRLLGGR